MKTIKHIISAILLSTLLLSNTSCDLELEPIDNYGSGSFWKTEAHFSGYMIGLRSDLRKRSFHHQFTLGEARGGSSKVGVSSGGESIYDGVIKNQALREDQPGVTNWGDIYGRITNLNLFIERTEETSVLSEDNRKKFLAEAYGMRAFWYFDLYRTYGSCPLQLKAKVVNGIVVPELLYEGRASASRIMEQIKLDLKNSYENFGDKKDFARQKSTWSRAATEALMGEVYLWTAKVTTDDDVANPNDIVKAKTHLLNLTTEYGLQLMPKFTDVFDSDPTKKGHSEAIMSIRYTEGEATNSGTMFVYNWMTSNFNNTWVYEDGRVTNNDTLLVGTTGQLRHEYKNGMFLNYDKDDSRRDATFLSFYNKETRDLAGTILRKNIGYFNKDKGVRIYAGDELWYRLAWVYLSLAEIENFEGGDPARYINMIRERAYGNKWDPAIHAYTNADFTTNELAILKEKDKELISEGQRWWDVRRMTLTKGGKSLVFVPEGNVDSSTPILNESTEAHKVLWPIEINMLNKDPLLTQTNGY